MLRSLSIFSTSTDLIIWSTWDLRLIQENTGWCWCSHGTLVCNSSKSLWEECGECILRMLECESFTRNTKIFFIKFQQIFVFYFRYDVCKQTVTSLLYSSTTGDVTALRRLKSQVWIFSLYLNERIFVSRVKTCVWRTMMAELLFTWLLLKDIFSVLNF